jgi:hypothetical protein
MPDGLYNLEKQKRREKSLPSLEAKDGHLDNIISKDAGLLRLHCLQDDSMFEIYLHT